MTLDRSRLDDLVPHRALYYGGAWHAPITGRFRDAIDPATGQVLGRVPEGGAEDEIGRAHV